MDVESRIPQCRHWHAAGPAGHTRHTDTRTHDYVRGDTLSLLAALNLDTGKIYYACAKRHRHQELLAFLWQLARHFPTRPALSPAA